MWNVCRYKKKIVKNQDLFRNKVDFWNLCKTKSPHIWIYKILNFINKSVKYKVTYNTTTIQCRKSGLYVEELPLLRKEKNISLTNVE